MRVVLRVLAGLVALVAILIVAAFFLPRTVTVARSVTINAPPDQIFPYVNALQQTEAWSPWLDRDPNVELSYSGPEAGVGNVMTWTSEQRDVGTGRQEITASVENERVETALDFGPMGAAEAYFDLQSEGTATQVTWGFETDLGTNPAARWMGLMMDGWVGADYEAGLANLKSVVEGS